jgi:hypothetical protein
MQRILVCAVSFCLACITSQASAVTITGSVKDEGGNKVPYGTIEILGLVTDTVLASTTADANGDYSLAGVSPAMCRIRGSKTGYEAETATISVSDISTVHIAPVTTYISDDPTAGDYERKGENSIYIYFQQAGTRYACIQTKMLARVTSNNPNFTIEHASVASPDYSTHDPVHHWHFRYDFGEGPAGNPSWGATPTWPTVQHGTDFWDWTYEGMRDGPGTNATFVGNCVSHALEGRASGRISVRNWVDSKHAEMAKFWAVLPTSVGNGKLAEIKIKTNDIAEDKDHLHVWKLLNPKGGEGNGPAQKIEWKNNASGVYTWTAHDDVSPNSCSPTAEWDGTPVAGYFTLTKKGALPGLFGEGKVRREAE